MKIHLSVADYDGCGYYRMQEPARIARMEGLDVTIGDAIPTEAGFDAKGKEMVRIRQAQDAYPYDVMVFQRPVKWQLLKYIPELQRRGVAVVIEMDDDLSSIDHRHPSYHFFQGKIEEGTGWRTAFKCAQIADMVTVTTPALAERVCSHGRVAVLPNCVPEWVLELPRISDGHTIGYTGAIHMHYGDLEATYGGVQLALADNPGWRFLKVGGGAELVQRGLSLADRPDQTLPLKIEDFHASIPTLDVGIVPLADTRFNEAKSYLKGIEYAACGVPFVASPAAAYQELHDRYGLGLLAKPRGRSWKTAVKALMEDESLHVEQAQLGREVAAQLTYRRQGYRWIEAWQQAIDNRREALSGRRAA